MGDLERIVDEQDRSATFRLLDEIADSTLDEDERARRVYALTMLDDPRASARRMALAEQTRRRLDVRAAALHVLGRTSEGLGPEEVRRWWASGDTALQSAALVAVERTEADLVGPVARDGSHPLYAYAIEGIEFRFEEPEWQDCKITALAHSSERVREVAAGVLMFDEPMRAEIPLQHATADPSSNVAVTAIETLQHYWSRSTIEVVYDG